MIKKKKSFSSRELGERFKQMRRALKKSRREIAGELNLHRSSITNIETGSTKPRIYHLKYLYDNYKVDMNWFLTGTGEMFLKEGGTGGPGKINGPVKGLKKPGKKEAELKYEELNRLMQIPDIETVILAKMQEMKIIYKEGIEKFFNGEEVK